MQGLELIVLLVGLKMAWQNFDIESSCGRSLGRILDIENNIASLLPAIPLAILFT